MVKFKDSSAWVGIVRGGKLDRMVEDRWEGLISGQMNIRNEGMATVATTFPVPEGIVMYFFK